VLSGTGDIEAISRRAVQYDDEGGRSFEVLRLTVADPATGELWSYTFDSLGFPHTPPRTVDRVARRVEARDTAWGRPGGHSAHTK
jgi:hypothetical protein